MRYGCILLLLLKCIFVSAQVIPDKDPQEFSIYLGGGLSAIHHQEAQYASFFNGSAIEFGVGYTYYFNRKWGIFVGLGPAIYNTDKRVDSKMLTAGLTDRNSYIFDLHTTTDYNEAFQIMFVNIPVMLQYQIKKNSQTWKRRSKSFNGFYLMGGIKASIPISDSYQSEVTGVTNAAYYPEMNNWAATQRFAGLGTFDYETYSEGNLAYDLGFNLALEAGVKWKLGHSYMLYTGAFCNIGLNNTITQSRAPIRNNIAVEHITDFTMLSFSDNINMTAAGIILRLSFYKTQDRSVCPYRRPITIKR